MGNWGDGKKHSVRLFFSREHGSGQNTHSDSHRQRSDRPKSEKTGHNPSGTQKVNIRRGA